jgi:predicted ATPase
MASRIEQIIEEIEEYVESCKFQPLSTRKIVVDKEEISEYLRELRLKTPDEIKRYQKIISNKDAILDDAQNRADAIIADAQQKAQEIAGEKEHFYDLVDSLFADTAKKALRTSNEIVLVQNGENLYPYQLSSGEKQMLIILLTVLVQNKEPYTLFMDEPEISLHVEWQQRLIGLIRDLNPNAQIILTTHSPAVIMDGWTDCVTDVEDIVV